MVLRTKGNRKVPFFLSKYIVGTYFVWFLSVQIKKLCYNNNEISYRGDEHGQSN